MSSRTKCNFCTLEDIKKAYPGKEVVVLRVGDQKICNLQVFVDGKGIGVWFQELSDHCVC
jgi:hypothetical protein